MEAFVRQRVSWGPASPVIGRPFAPKAEAELMPGIVAAALTIIRRGCRVHLLPELRGPHGVADLVVLQARDSVLANRLATGVPPLLNQLDAAIVATLAPREPKTLYEVSLELRCEERHLAPRVERLRRIGAIGITGMGFVRPAALAPLGRLYAFEAKVTDWKKGCLQAADYAAWADSATFATGRLPRDRSAVLELATTLRLGVIEDRTWVRQPELEAPTAPMRLWASEHALAALTR